MATLCIALGTGVPTKVVWTLTEAIFVAVDEVSISTSQGLSVLRHLRGPVLGQGESPNPPLLRVSPTPPKPSRDGNNLTSGRLGSVCRDPGCAGRQRLVVVFVFRSHPWFPRGRSPFPDLHGPVGSASGRQVVGACLPGPARPGSVRGSGLDSERFIPRRYPRHPVDDSPSGQLHAAHSGVRPVRS
jgi:hypothetical protein